MLNVPSIQGMCEKDVQMHTMMANLGGCKGYHTFGLPSLPVFQVVSSVQRVCRRVALI